MDIYELPSFEFGKGHFFYFWELLTCVLLFSGGSVFAFWSFPFPHLVSQVPVYFFEKCLEYYTPLMDERGSLLQDTCCRLRHYLEHVTLLSSVK